ncbi:MAG: malonyl-[acyl-carrier protein] O-methyltransferase BioC [Piscirickettsiaceae bacterium]|nr:MAG: malonyl-[acyl-carrier protein] O-methyltransferase BioC [Piscirickettsiaceae bacterium]
MTESVADIDKQLVRRSFEQAAGHYNQFTSLQRDIGNRLMANYIGAELVVDNMVDIGCGTGYLTNKLIQAYPSSNLYAVDISFAMLQQTKQQVATSQYLNLGCADADKLPFAASSMDVVCSNLAFQWCSNLEKTFAQAAAILKENGQFIFATFGPQTLKELKYAWGFADNSVHINQFSSVEEISAALSVSGFANISIYTEDLVLSYKTPHALMRDLKGMGAHNINTSRNRGLTGVKSFQRMINAYQSLLENDCLPATFQAVYVKAQMR